VATATKEKPPVGGEQDHVDPKTGELVSAEDQARALALADAEAYDEDAGAGFENQTAADVAVPFLAVLQPTSPQVQSDHPDAPRPGGIINTTTGAVVLGSVGMLFVPALTRHVFVEWVDRDKGGGYIGEHEVDSDLIKRVRTTQPLGDYKHPETGNDLVETFYVYGLQVGDDGIGWPAIFPFSSTFIRPYRDWMFKAKSISIKLPDRVLTNLPLFAHTWRIKTVRNEKNGNTWFTPVVGFAGNDAEDSRNPPTSQLYEGAKQVRAAISSGALRAATETLAGGGKPEDGAGREGRETKKAANAPF